MKNNYICFYLLLFICMNFTAVHAQNIIINRPNTVNGILLNDKSQFALNQEESLNPNKLLSDQDFKKINVNSNKEVWMKFTIESNSQDTIYIYSKRRVPKMALYSLDKSQINLIGITGFAERISDSNVKGNYTTIAIPPFSTKTFLLKLSSERYFLSIPNLYASTFIYSDPESHSFDTISLLTAGFELCLFITIIMFLLFNRNKKFPNYLIPFLLINFSDAIYFLSRSNLLIIETSLFPSMTNSNFWNALGDVNILLYYLFYRSFFDIPKNSWIYKITTVGILFWIVQMIIELTDFRNPHLMSFASKYLHFAAIMDSIILFSILMFVYFKRLNSVFYKLGAVGLTLITLSSMEISFNRIFDGNTTWLNLSLTSFKILQFAMLANLTSFITAMMYNYIKSEKEKNEMKLQLVTHELERQKVIQQERERISHDMHDDLGAGISAMKLQTEYIRQKVKDENVKTDIDDLLKTSEDMNISMREMLWSLNSQNDHILNFADYVTNYAQNFFKKSNIKILISSTNLTNKMISAESRRNLFLCIKEGMNNIYKHSFADNVYLDFEQNNSELIVNLQDDGIGVLPTSKGGNGFSSMQRRMSILNGDCEIIESERGLHLKFSLKL